MSSSVYQGANDEGVQAVEQKEDEVEEDERRRYIRILMSNVLLLLSLPPLHTDSLFYTQQ